MWVHLTGELSPGPRIVLFEYQKIRNSDHPKNLLVEEYCVWVKEQLANTAALPKGKTMQGLRYSVNQEKYLREFLKDGEVPIDNLASERALRTFTIDRKNFVLINTMRGARASATLYNITETAKLNRLNVYYYVSYLLANLSELADENGIVDEASLEPLMPWSKVLPENCYSKRRT